MSMRSAGVLAFVIFAGLTVSACGGSKPPALATPTRTCPSEWPSGEIELAGGSFMLGAAAEYDEEGPPRSVVVKPFAIDRTEVTNAQFAQFVKATGYVTMAERKPKPADYPGIPTADLRPAAMVFVGAKEVGNGDASGWWRVVEGANWRHPEGPGSTIEGRERHPVVQVGYEDALAYARWKGRDLPTEAQWEFAARAGLDGKRYEWGDEHPDPADPKANTWQGAFPAIDAGDDGYKARTAPVACYPASRYGLYDMSGNVWEWTKDLYQGEGGKGPGTAHLIKGGSFLCADNFCHRYRPSARQSGPTDTGSSHVGFRTVRREATG